MSVHVKKDMTLIASHLTISPDITHLSLIFMNVKLILKFPPKDTGSCWCWCESKFPAEYWGELKLPLEEWGACWCWGEWKLLPEAWCRGGELLPPKDWWCWGELKSPSEDWGKGGKFCTNLVFCARSDVSSDPLSSPSSSTSIISVHTKLSSSLWVTRVIWQINCLDWKLIPWAENSAWSHRLERPNKAYAIKIEWLRR